MKISDENLKKGFDIDKMILDNHKKLGIKSKNVEFSYNAELELIERRKGIPSTRISDEELNNKLDYIKNKVCNDNSNESPFYLYNILSELKELRKLDNKEKSIEEQFREVRDKYPLVWEIIVHECPVECQVGFHCYPCKLDLQNVSRFDECWDKALKIKE